MTRAQKQSSFCLLQNRRPESQSPTFRRPADIGYNTLDFASKVRVPKRGVAPFGFPHHFRFSDTKPTLPVLHPCPGNHKEAPPPSSKGMLTVVLLYIYPKVVFMQYCVSVSCGIVSLTKGTSCFPSRYRPSGYVELLSKLFLCKPFFFSEFSQELSYFYLIHRYLPSKKNVPYPFQFVQDTKRAMSYFISGTVLSHPINYQEKSNLLLLSISPQD